MFRSIRWRFIIIYFLLVFLAMSIVGVFITTQLEKMQLVMTSKSMKTHIASIIASSTSLQKDNWEDNVSEIKESISSKIQIGYNENVYIILNNNDKTIIASSVNEAIGKNAYESKRINNYVLLESIVNEVVTEKVPPEGYDGIKEKVNHMSYPVKNNNGGIKGFIYITNKLDNVVSIVDESKIIITQATLIALLITIIVGFIIASGITKPIKDLTIKARDMSKGNFDQYVDVRSNDEIGQLGNMFNYLTKELKKNISEVHREKSKIETTFNYMTDGVLTVDKNGYIIHANPVAYKILRMSSKDDNYNDLTGSINNKLPLKEIKKKSWQGSSIIQFKNDIYKINYAPFKDDRNEIGGVILVIQDITEQHRLQEMRKEFVANVSHELKTPITTIKSYAETLLEGALENKEITKDFLNVINSESDRMGRLVSDLLKLSKMDYKQAKWNKKEIDANQLLIRTYKKLKIAAESKKINIYINTQENLPSILFDEDGLEQIIQNILSNAIKYTQEEGKIYLITFSKYNNIVISIKDNGVGIPEKDISRIFERFYRVDKARTREMGGTGLGLSIAKYIAEDHDSDIEINSKVNVGTEVNIIIPKLD